MLNQISLISNICFEPYWRTCVEQYLGDSFKSTELKFISYESYQDGIREIASSDIVLVYLSFEELYPDILNDFSVEKITYKDVEKDCIRICSELYSSIKKHSNASIFWFGFEDYYCADRLKFGSSPVFEGLVDRINLFLFDLIPKDSFIDLKRLIASVSLLSNSPSELISNSNLCLSFSIFLMKASFSLTKIRLAALSVSFSISLTSGKYHCSHLNKSQEISMDL